MLLVPTVLPRAARAGARYKAAAESIAVFHIVPGLAIDSIAAGHIVLGLAIDSIERQGATRRTTAGLSGKEVRRARAVPA